LDGSDKEFGNGLLIEKEANMNEAIQIAQQGLWLILELSLIPLLSSLIVGLIISLFQALTQIQEQTLTFVPKVIVTALIIIWRFPSMIESMKSFTATVFEVILRVGASPIG
jgi:flagellar biosynthesis protein FliQ